MNKFILKRQKNSVICFLLRTDYRQVFQGTLDECKEYALNSPGIIKKEI